MWDAGATSENRSFDFHHYGRAVDVADGIGVAVHRFIVKLLLAADHGIEFVAAELDRLGRGVARLGGHDFLHLLRPGAVIVSRSSEVGE